MDEKYTVCIGRQYGSGGREVGALVAEKLGVTCYDKLLIQEAARKSGMDETFLKNNEERLTEVLLPFSGNTFADEANMAGVFYSAGENAYGAEKQAIVSIADRESAVIIGRFHSFGSKKCALRFPVCKRSGLCGANRPAQRPDGAESPGADGTHQPDAQALFQFLFHDRVGQAGEL